MPKRMSVKGRLRNSHRGLPVFTANATPRIETPTTPRATPAIVDQRSLVPSVAPKCSGLARLAGTRREAGSGLSAGGSRGSRRSRGSRSPPTPANPSRAPRWPYGGGKVGADRLGSRLAEIRRAHQVAPALDGVLALEHHGQAGSLGHEGAEAVIEGPRAVHRVEAGRLLLSHVDEPGGQDLEAGLLDARDDLAHDALGDGVRLDDGEGALNRAHAPITLATVAPMSAGLLTSVAPAASSAFIFSAAVPFPPAMIAPA